MSKILLLRKARQRWERRLELAREAGDAEAVETAELRLDAIAGLLSAFRRSELGRQLGPPDRHRGDWWPAAPPAF
jgi:hypothetical protein